MTLYTRPVLEIPASTLHPQTAPSAALSLQSPPSHSHTFLSVSEWKGLVFEATEAWLGLPTQS